MCNLGVWKFCSILFRIDFQFQGLDLGSFFFTRVAFGIAEPKKFVRPVVVIEIRDKIPSLHFLTVPRAAPAILG